MEVDIYYKGKKMLPTQDHAPQRALNFPFSQFFKDGGGKSPAQFPPLAPVMRLASKQTIFQEGDKASFLFMIISGTIKAYRLLSDGRRLITGFFGPGDIIGMSARGNYPYSADTVTEVAMGRISAAKLEKRMIEDPGVAQQMLRLAYGNLQSAQDSMVLLGRKNSVEKIAHFLLGYAERASSQPGELIEIDLPMSRADIADYLGLTTETVSRTMSKLKQKNIIAAEGARTIRLKSIGKLAELAESYEM